MTVRSDGFFYLRSQLDIRMNSLAEMLEMWMANNPTVSA
jgi:hypothetical protein